MSVDEFHKIALPLYGATALFLLAMAVCALLLKRDGDHEKQRRRDETP